jgi:hypothetical protein
MPNVVKGSKQERMVVVPHRPVRRLILLALSFLIVVATALGGFVYAYYQTTLRYGLGDADQLVLAQQVERLEAENLSLSRQVTVLDRSNAMDRKVAEDMQVTVGSLRNRVAKLEQDIVFYRSVISGDGDDTGLTISNWEISPTNDADRYRYKLMLRQQDADGDTFLIGHVNINLVGRKNEEITFFPIRDVSFDQEENDIKLRFKFFQIIEGELILPFGFVPERVQVIGVEKSPIQKSLDQSFDWVLPE